MQIPDLQIADSAAVMPVVTGDSVLYKYKSRDQVIVDFETRNNCSRRVRSTRVCICSIA